METIIIYLFKNKGRNHQMHFNGLFVKKILIEQGEKLLIKYCEVNGFEDSTTSWKRPTHAKHWLAYRRRSNRMISKNWVSYHHIRGEDRYSIWIDLVSEEIREVLR
jgi:hypothetical protein